MKTRWRMYGLLAGMVCAGVVLTSCRKDGPSFECEDPLGCVSLSPDEPLKIGVLQALSGGANAIGIEQVNMIKLAVAERNSKFLEHKIELLYEDSRCSPEGGKVAAQKLVTNPQVMALLGTSCSVSSVTAGEVMSEAGFVMISGSSSAPALTQIGGEKGDNWQPGFFRTRHNDAAMGQAAAMFAFRELGVTRVATINDGDPYTKGLTDIFGETFTKLGGEIVLDAVVDKGDDNMEPVLTAVTLFNAEFVFLPLFHPEGVSLVRQAKKMSALEDVVLMGATALALAPFINTVGEAGVGMYFVNVAMLTEFSKDKLLKAYTAEYGVAPFSSAYGTAYDAVSLLWHALEATVVSEKDGTLHVGRQALRDALYATTGLNGMTGTLTCDEFGDCGSARFDILRLDDPSAGLEGLRSNVVYRYMPNEPGD